MGLAADFFGKTVKNTKKEIEILSKGTRVKTNAEEINKLKKQLFKDKIRKTTARGAVLTPIYTAGYVKVQEGK